MVLEATIIVVDNSESSRNGDYIPTRWGAQSEAVSMVFNAKTNANPESSVGLMSMGGKGPEVLVTLTTDLGKILDGMHRTKIWGTGHLTTAIAVAALALKHRQNHSQRQRIVVFTCSSLSGRDAPEDKPLVSLARKLKKSNVSVDFVAFGDLSTETKSKLETFHENVKAGSEGSSNLVFVPPGPKLLSDVLIGSPILAGEGGGDADGSGAGIGENAGITGNVDGSIGGGGGAAGGAVGTGTGLGPEHEFGIDPSLDPELAMALRMSMEEETNRLERQRVEREKQEQQQQQQQQQEDSQPQSTSQDQTAAESGIQDTNAAAAIASETSSSKLKGIPEESGAGRGASQQQGQQSQVKASEDNEANQSQEQAQQQRATGSDGSHEKGQDGSGGGSNNEDKMDTS